MKKIFAIVLCVMLVCMMSVVAFATDAEVVEGDATIGEPPVETPPVETPPEEAPPDNEKPDAQIEAELTTDKIVNYLTEHLEEFSVILTMVLTVFYQVRKHIELNKSIATMNNNTVSVAQSSANAIANTVSGMAGMTDVLTGYKAEMERMLAEIRANEEEKHKMAAMLEAVDAHLKTSKSANLELSNEVAELLVLANIPNSKKDELYARHRAAVEAMAAAEETEVKENDGEEA